MAVSKFLILSVFLALFFSHIRADVSVEGEGGDLTEVVRSDGSDSSALKIELDKLNSKIQEYESRIDDKIRELKKKDELIAQKAKFISEKSESISTLQREIASLQKKEKLDAQEQVGKAHARAEQLEKQVDEYKRKFELQNRKKEGLEAQLNEALGKKLEFSLELEKIRRINDEQRTKIHKTERALRVAKEELMKAKSEATSKIRELTEVHGAWLPPWLASNLVRCQSFLETRWNQNAKPALNLVIEKAVEGKAQAEKWAKPHVETIKTKWVPALKEQWLVVKTNAEPHVKALSTKTLEVYEASKNAVTPRLIRVQEVVDSYFQEAKRATKPYFDQVATMAKPHVDKVQVTLKPYTKELVRAYGKFLQSATIYHHQVQDSVQEVLHRHELVRPLATKELVWFAASAFLALPIIILFNLCSAIFRKKTKKPVRTANSNHSRRKAKRGHPDK